MTIETKRITPCATIKGEIERLNICPVGIRDAKLLARIANASFSLDELSSLRETFRAKITWVKDPHQSGVPRAGSLLSELEKGLENVESQISAFEKAAKPAAAPERRAA